MIVAGLKIFEINVRVGSNKMMSIKKMGRDLFARNHRADRRGVHKTDVYRKLLNIYIT